MTQQTYVDDSEINIPQSRSSNRYEDKEDKIPFSDIFDIYHKASSVHSRLSDMNEDYTLSRYDVDVYNNPIPKFIREQRKLLRIIKTFVCIPQATLMKVYNDEKKVEAISKGLAKEFAIIEEIMICELDEVAIMARSMKGEVITAFLQVGATPEHRLDISESNKAPPTTGQKLNERS